MRRYLPTLCAVWLLAPAVVRAADPDPAAVAFFEAKIRPVLVENCYSCHSVEGKQRGGLRLDTRDAVLKGGDTGPALVPGKPEQSLILKAIRHDGPIMPPKSQLSDAVVADFERWIEYGAPDPRDGKTVVAKSYDFVAARRFWAFQPPRKVAPPAVKNTAWPKNDIDRFVLARLEEAGLQPVRPADRRALIRRASFDLIGLPPTPEEVEAFVNDTSPDAWAKVVDRLLASPHYGERWGRYWLDVARYAEDQAHTFAVTPNTQAFRYRDWVVSAINDDMPYDRFVKLQIAADLIETDDARRLKDLPALGFFGLGAQYYKNTDAARAEADELDDRVDTLTRGFLGLTVSCARCHDHKFDPIPTQDYYSIAGVFRSSKLANLPLAPADEVKRFDDSQKKIKAADEQLKAFVRTEKVVLIEAQAAEADRYLLAVRHFQAKKADDAKWSLAAQAKADGLDPLLLQRWSKYLNGTAKMPALDAWKRLPPPRKDDPADADAVQAAKSFKEHLQATLAAGTKNPGGKNDLVNALTADNAPFALSDAELKERLPEEKRGRMDRMQTELADLKKSAPPAPPVTHGLTEAGPVDMHIFVRGNPATPGELAPRRFLRIVAGDNPPAFKQGSGRLELAEAIASRDNPLTARVVVNRLWQHHFGRGLVGTPSNFGALGERPTHPELLDYLAVRLVESGWSLKAVHRDILLSATYQLSSDRDEKALNVDADNRLLWRMSRRRLDIEAWRDAMLAVSGRLDGTIGGPPFDLNQTDNRRRTVYARISRHDLNALLRLFDFPDANITSDHRSETTVPQQQLFVLNSPFVVEQAKALAARVQAEAADDETRVRRAFAVCFGRPATDAEVRLALNFLKADDPAEEKAKIKLTRWERLAQVLLGSNEFMYVD